MTHSTLTVLVQKNSKVLKIVWIALLIAIVLYTGLSLSFSYAGGSDLSNAVKYVLYAFAGVLALGSVLIYKKVLSEKSIKKKLLNNTSIDELAKDIGTNKIDEDKKSALETLSVRELKLYGLSGSFFVPFVVCWALNESIVLIGFVISYLYKDAYEIVPFALAGLLLHVQMYPGLEQIVDRAQAMPELDQ